MDSLWKSGDSQTKGENKIKQTKYFVHEQKQ